MSQLADALQDGVLTDAELSGITPPTIAPFTFDSFAVDRIGGIFSERITDGPFTGLPRMNFSDSPFSQRNSPASPIAQKMETSYTPLQSGWDLPFRTPTSLFPRSRKRG